MFQISVGTGAGMMTMWTWEKEKFNFYVTKFKEHPLMRTNAFLNTSKTHNHGHHLSILLRSWPDLGHFLDDPIFDGGHGESRTSGETTYQAMR